MNIIKKFFRGLIYFAISLTIIFAMLYLFTSGIWQVAETVDQDSTISHVIIDDIIFHSESFGNDSSRVLIVILPAAMSRAIRKRSG